MGKKVRDAIRGGSGGKQNRHHLQHKDNNNPRRRLWIFAFLWSIAFYQGYWIQKNLFSESETTDTKATTNTDQSPEISASSSSSSSSAAAAGVDSPSAPSHPSPDHVIFFNLYSHTSEDFSEEFYPHAQGELLVVPSTVIFQEQLEHLVKSRSKFLPIGQHEKWVVYATSSGNINMTKQDGLQEICNRSTRVSTQHNITIQCIQQQRLPVGGELDTLTNLYNYCQQQESAGSGSSGETTTRVTYLHNKGSFNGGADQHLWRRAMTDATIHRDCLDPPDSTCNICGLQFVAPPEIYAPVFPGNFYTASCDYVKQLLPPKIFAKQMASLSWEVIKWVNRGNFVFAYENDDKAWSLGKGRYAAEHWITSHPLAKPCHMYAPEREHWYWRKNGHWPDGREFEWSMFPNVTKTTTTASAAAAEATGGAGGQSKEEGTTTRTRVYNASWIRESLRLDIAKRKKYFIYLPGLLYRQIQLYNQTPPFDSWWYQYLPDGMFWKQAVQQYGNDVLKEVLNITMASLQ